MNSRNRISFNQPDYIFMIVRMPAGWQPSGIHDVPPVIRRVLSKTYVASFDEACDDLVRCNKLSMERSLKEWAIIQAVEAGL